ncbi:MAG: DNA replication and repair protein RecF [Moraxella sp.]|nr:DNA replication and repair protein RecF [Moraxella sp.]
MIDTLKIKDLRNLGDISLSLGAVNVFIGKNGSGKTSLLESVFLLSRGKSFRHFEAKRYISHTKDTCTIWAAVGDDSFAIAKHKDPNTKTDLRHNQSPLSGQATLTKRLPTLIIDPSGMDILEDGSASRRQLLDWLCFHTEDGFHTAWLNYQRLLKQRNALLKTAQAAPEHSEKRTALIAQIHAWDSGLSEYAHQLHAMRQTAFLRWQATFATLIDTLLPAYQGQINLGLLAGFDTDTPLKTHLAQRLAQDIELGYTRVGVHRADLTISLKSPLDNGKTHKEQAVNVLSRGEKKLLITALKLSSLMEVCTQTTDSTPLVLIDDIDSELDENATMLLLKTLLGLPCQLFISSLNESLVHHLKNHTKKDLRVFSLAQGKATPL